MGFPIVGIGASAGGLEAFSELLKHLPPDTGMAFVLIQHLDPQHPSALVQLLARATSLPVQEVTQDVRAEPDHVYVIAPDTGLGIEAGMLKPHARAAGRAPNRAVDVFFEALAADQRECAIGVILSGAASDGTLGLEAIKAEGGITLAQDESARHDSMPNSAVAAGCVDFVLSPQGIALELARIARHPYMTGAAVAYEVARSSGTSSPERDHASAVEHQDDGTALPSGGSGTPDTGARQAQAEAAHGRGGAGFQKVLLLLRNHCGVDFSLYKSNTIQRRITRRMLLCKFDTPEQYAHFLRGNARELDALYSDVLISVTSFFRNPEAFEALQREVFPTLLAQGGDEPVRVWVLGCSTGQEAYSLAMAFTEVAEQAPRPRTLQIFATDLNDALLGKARHGLYAKSLAADLSPERLRRFFVEEEGGWRISKRLREMVVFARQNLISDPPFSRMDLITCRNVLIYLESGLQKKIFPVFHYALKPRGTLWLGASESIGGFTDLFEPLDRKYRIYSKKVAATPLLALPLARQRGDQEALGQAQRAATALRVGAVAALAQDGFRAELNAQREADRIVINQFAPPSVLINDALQVLQFRGATSAFLEPPMGKASFDVLKMARKGLMLPLRAAITRARKENKTARKNGVRFEYDGDPRKANIEVVPLKNLRDRCFLVLFESAEDGAASEQPARPARQRSLPRAAEPGHLADLQAELDETLEYVQSIQEQYESANEELQAASEEVQSSNEELQSLNEELTTSKEELESSNEELITLNEEMVSRNAELNRLNSDLVNIQTSAHLVTVLLARDLTIRRFSAQAERQFNLLASDVGRPIGHIRHGLELPELEALISEVIDTVRAQERELRGRDGRWFSLRLRPYLTLDNKVDGAVLVLMDIDAIKRAEQAVADSEARYRAMFEATTVGISESDAQTARLLHVNERLARITGYGVDELPGKTWTDLTHPDDRAVDEAGHARLLRGEIASHEVEKRLLRKDGSSVWVQVTVNLVRVAVTGQPQRTVAVTLDINEQRQARQALAQLAAIVSSSDDAIIGKDLNGILTSWNGAAERLFGYSAAEAVGQSVTLLIPVDRADEETVILQRVRRGETINHFETVRRRKDGSLVDVSLTISPIRDSTGALIGASKIAHDTTEQKRAADALRVSEQRYRHLYDSIDEGFCVIEVLFDSAGMADDYRYLEVNPAFEKQSGLHGAVGKRIRELAPDETQWAQWAQRYAQVALTGEPVRFVAEAKALGRWFDVYAFRLDTPQGWRVACLFTDITERRQVEHALRDADQRKNEFLALLAHELRNPLAPMRNALEVLRRANVAEMPTFPLAAFTMMERQIGQMVRLIDDLLDVSRISRGKIELRLEVVDLCMLAQQVVEGARPACESNEQHLALALPREPVRLMADPVRLAQLIGNLVHNASKFTDRGGRIDVLLEIEGEAAAPPGTPAQQQRIVIRVRDNGIGIAADQRERIFEMFTQADASLERASGGLGIGLALVKDLAELHGGTVAVHSAGIGHGSEFVVRLPAGMDAPVPVLKPSAQAPGETAPMAVLRILVVDDNRDAAESLAMLLQFDGHETHLAHDGIDAVEAAQRLRPDVILLDIGLPGLNGYDTARRIRAQKGDADKRPLIVALTGWGQDDDRRRSEQAGFDAHLVKPVGYEDLMRLLAEA